MIECVSVDDTLGQLTGQKKASVHDLPKGYRNRKWSFSARDPRLRASSFKCSGFLSYRLWRGNTIRLLARPALRDGPDRGRNLVPA